MRILRPLLLALLLADCAGTQATTTAAPQPAPPPTVQIAMRPVVSPTPSSPDETRFVDSLLARMTLEEKIGQLNQLSGGQATGPGGSNARLSQIERGEVGSLFNVIGADSIRALQRIAVERSRLHIPLVFGLDVIHGYRTEFPVPLGDASAWDPAASERATRIAATEAAAAGLDWTFAPMVDIAHDPRWGRIVEGAGEDPYLGSVLAAARVRGFQGRGVRNADAVAATVKHFVAYGAAEGGRDYNTAEVSERTLREIYLPPFHAAVCAGAQTLMAAFDDIAGIPAHANRHTLTDILRREWGFNGMVVSDWTGVGELLNHGIGGDTASVALASLDAGTDMDMVSEVYLHGLPALVRSGRMPQATIDEAVRRVLRFKYRLGLFTDPYHGASGAGERAAMLTPANRAAAREIGRESLVLLKNDGNVLPLRKDLGTIAVIGALAADSGAQNGNWVGQARQEDAISLLTGIRRAVSPRTNVRFAAGASPTSMDSSGIAEAVRVARQADVVVLAIGEIPDQSAEASSRASIELPGAQLALVRAVRATGKPVVAVLMNGRPLAIPFLADSVPAILETWFAGVEGGNAIADVLFGDYNPGGKLPVTFPRATGQIPIYYNHRNTGRPAEAANKYSSKYLDLPWTPQWVFGHGLSYTTFSYAAPRLSATTMRPGDTLRVSVDVTNSGARAGDEVVQLYLRDEVASIAPAVQRLRGFQRIHLAPGEHRTVTFPLTVDDLAFWNIDVHRVAEPGAFRVMTGGSSATVQQARFTLETMGNTPVEVPESCSR